MLIYELQPEQVITIHTRIGDNTLAFPSIIREVYPKKRAVIAEAVLKDGKPISFHAAGVIVDVLVTFADERPLLFKNVTVKLLKRKENQYCYFIQSILDGVVYNRRGSFRCYIGIDTTAQLGLNTAPVDATIRDISISGFSIVCGKKVNVNPGTLLHAVLTDQPTPNGTIYNFQLYGLVARLQELENGRLIIGCRYNHPIQGIDKYIMEKERIRIHNARG